MKLSVAMLLIVGVVAAGAAAVLLGAVRSYSAGPQVTGGAAELQVIVATRPLEAYTVVQSDCVKTRRIPALGVPKDTLSDPAHVIGKALRMPVAEGQLFTSATFATDDSPQSVASRLLPAGKRAKTIALTDDAAMRGLLYPGCAVDVLWCFNGTAAQGNPLSKVVLENITVLAVNRQTALSSDDSGSEVTSGRVDARHTNMVTLLLDAQQAEALQLALDQGSIALVLRNPTDVALGAPRPLGLSALTEDRLAFGSSKERVQGLLASLQEFGKTLAAGMNQGRPAVAAEASTVGQEWETIIIRGEKLEKARFIVSAAD